MFSQHLASPAVITPKPPAAADRVISHLFADSGLGLLNRSRLNVAPWTRPLRSGSPSPIRKPSSDSRRRS